MKQRPGGIAFAIIVGLIVATISYRWVVDPAPREQRERELQVVERARAKLQQLVAADSLEIVDPLEPDRKVGKVYVYPAGAGWEVSGFYRRNPDDLWHPWLMRLDAELAMVQLRVSDQAPEVIERAGRDPAIEILP
jgi:hypothetical protein